MKCIVDIEKDSPLKVLFSVKLFSLLLLFSPVVDVVTGALLLSGHSLSLSAIYKGGLFLLCILRLLGGVPGSWAKWIITGLLLSAATLLIPSLGFDFHVLFYNVNLMTKCCIAFGVIGVYGLFLEEEPRETAVWLRRIFEFYGWFFPLSIIVPGILGVGFSTYTYGVGFKGFYFAGNDISIVLVVMAAISVEIFRKKASLLHGAQAMLAMLSLLLIGTKTCLLMAAVIVVFFILRSPNVYIRIGFLAAAALAGLLLLRVFGEEISQLYHSLRYRYWWYQEQGGSILSFLLSGRDFKLREALTASYQTEGWKTLLFGTGAWQQLNLPEYHGLVEMDLFDLLIWHGLPLTVFVVTAWARMYGSVRHSAEFILKFCWWSGIAFSFLVGHVLFSPLANIMLALVYVAMLGQKTRDRREGAA